MATSNRLSKVVQATHRFPKALRSTIWSKAFGRVVPMVGTANLRYLEVTPGKVVVHIENNRNMRNHIGQVHAAAMALLAETATGFVVGMNVSDDQLILIKSLHVDYKKPTQGAMTATAILTEEQQRFIQTTPKGELLVPVTVVDETNGSPIECAMLWAWLPKKKK